MYFPYNFEDINIIAGNYNPSPVKYANNQTFNFWVRSLFQRATSVLKFDLPDEWQGDVRDFFIYCLFRFGYVAIFKNDKFGLTFQPCSLSEKGFYYQPLNARISNPLLSADLKIGEDCEILKLTPDYFGVFDIIEHYAERLSTLDNAIDMSIINNKLAYILGARNKSAADAIKKVFDKINKGEPTIVLDMKLLNDRTDKDVPWQFLERKGLKDSYLTTMQLQDAQTILNNFDAEIGIPTIPYQKKERMVTSEAESRVVDSTSRSLVWFDCLKSSIEDVKKLYPEIKLDVKLRYDEKEVDSDGETDTDRSE
ncbi:MAG: hypothetical protein KBT36_08955 [Kurthia sp.]|nr:hypothetical protein [Candidatus Kurthia equi]